jgi:hypothetical protein
MTLTHYAAATKLSKSSLCRWRDLINSGEIEIAGERSFIPVPARK